MLTSLPALPALPAERPHHDKHVDNSPSTKVFTFDDIRKFRLSLQNSRSSSAAIMIPPTAKESLLDMFSLKGKVVVVTGK